MINFYEVVETNQMIEEENLDVRTITLGISLMDCIDSDLDRLNEKIYKKMISNLDLVLNSNLYTSIFITLGRHNIDKIDEIFKFIEEKKPNGFYINPIKKKIGNEFSGVVLRTVPEQYLLEVLVERKVG